MVQRCGGYTYEQGGLRGRVGKERGGKEGREEIKKWMDVPLQIRIGYIK
jgi:hypothetical protein